jgi:hypothetical protein
MGGIKAMKSGRRDARGQIKSERNFHKRWEELQRRKAEKLVVKPFAVTQEMLDAPSIPLDAHDE